ncbi:hypothetical protein V2G26_000292 [Clonostachys chloroleuca]
MYMPESKYQRCGLSVLAEPKESAYIAALVLVCRPSGVQSCVISIKPAGPVATGDGAISVSSATKSIVSASCVETWRRSSGDTTKCGATWSAGSERGEACHCRTNNGRDARGARTNLSLKG